jgi:hypothetical protein
MLLSAESLPQPYGIHRLESLRQIFDKYPPYHVYLGVAYATAFISDPKPEYREKALAEFKKYMANPVTIYSRDPYRFSLLMYKSNLVHGKEKVECLNALMDDHLLLNKDWNFYALLINGYLETKQVLRVKKVLGQWEILAKERNEPILNNLLSMAKLELNAEEFAAQGSKTTQKNYNLLYSGRLIDIAILDDLRKSVANDSNYLTLVAPYFYQLYGFENGSRLSPQPVRWREYYAGVLNPPFYSLCFQLPFKSIITPLLIVPGDRLAHYRPEIVILKTNESAIYFDSAALVMRDMYTSKKPKHFILTLNGLDSRGGLAVELVFDPSKNPFSFRLARLQ